MFSWLISILLWKYLCVQNFSGYKAEETKKILTASKEHQEMETGTRNNLGLEVSSEYKRIGVLEENADGGMSLMNSKIR